MEFVASIGKQLAEIVDAQSRCTVRKIVSGLESPPLRIAFVGPVKAGKSTLVNAFAKQPGFLPADVNPWTTAVSALHFGLPNPGGLRACFRFFQADEWARLAGRDTGHGIGGHPGLSDSQRDSLAQQFEQMERRARNRLGDQFHQLLGREHRVKDLNGEILRHYVCTGDPPGETPVQQRRGHAEGRFADITKSADMYFDAGPFAIPTTVIDTPGINDHSVIRDEIAQQALGHADLHVLVISARQVMAEGEACLTRLARALNLSQMAVFVSGIDQLDEPAIEAPKIDRQVRQILQRQFPAADIPVIVGSGAWGELALQESPRLASSEARKLRAFGEYLSRAGYVAASDAGLRELCSGLPRLARTLAELAAAGPFGGRIQSAVTALSDIARPVKSAADMDVRDQSVTAPRPNVDEKTRAERRQRFADELSLVQNLVPRLEALTKHRREELARVTQESLADLNAAFEGAFEAFVNIETRSLRNVDSAKSRIWTCDPSRMRGELEHDLVNGFARTQHAMANILSAAATDLRAIVSEHVKVDRDSFRGDFADLRSIAPSVASMAQVVAFDVEFPRWKDFWRFGGASHARAEALGKIVRSTFQPVCDTVRESGEGSLTELGAAAVAKLDALYELAANAARRHADRLASLAGEYELTGDAALLDGMAPAEDENATMATRLAGLIEEIEALSDAHIPAAKAGRSA
ncbi:MAG TPA: dynamin family protein [Thermohalobaculum sp.]|nr:dynamin family protein [Thermohalobaculum sp.]